MTALMDNQIKHTFQYHMTQIELIIAEKIQQENNNKLTKVDDDFFEDRERICALE